MSENGWGSPATSRDADRPRANRALIQACKEGFIDIVQLLLLDGRIDASQPYNRALVAATHGGHVEIVRLLLSQPGVSVHDIHAPDVVKYDPPSLLLEALGRSCDVVRLLLEQKGVDPNAGYRPWQTRSALSCAASGGHVDVLRVLLSSGRITTLGCKKDALLEAVRFNEPAAVRLMLAQPDIDPQSVTFYGQPLIRLAATRMDFRDGTVAGALRALLEDGRADPNEVDFGGFTPLRAAVTWGRTDAVAALLADPRVDVTLGLRPRIEPPRIRGFEADDGDDGGDDDSDDDDDDGGDEDGGDEDGGDDGDGDLDLDDHDEDCCHEDIDFPDSEEKYERRFRPIPGRRPRGDELDSGLPLLHLAAACTGYDIIRLLLADPRIDPCAAGHDGQPAIMSVPHCRDASTMLYMYERDAPKAVAALLGDPRVHPTDASAAPSFYERALQRSRHFAGHVFTEDPYCARWLRCPLPESVRPYDVYADGVAHAVQCRAWQRRLRIVAARERAFAEE